MNFKDILKKIDVERAEISREYVAEAIGHRNTGYKPRLAESLSVTGHEKLTFAQKIKSLIKKIIKENPLTRRIINKMYVLVRRDMSAEFEQLKQQNAKLKNLQGQADEILRLKAEVDELSQLIETIASGTSVFDDNKTKSYTNKRTRIVIMLNGLTSHDAIGNDVMLMYRLLKNRFDCSVYAGKMGDSSVEYVSLQTLKKIIADETAIIIYHHSFDWDEGIKLLKKSKCKLIIRYHNITPEKFFKHYNETGFYDGCKRGRMQTVELQKMFPQAFWLCDSKYNMEDIYLIPNAQKAVCPPFNKISEWADIIPDETVRRKLSSDSIKLLFVGRVVPNKGHLMLLDVLKYYIEKYESNIELNIIGKKDPELKEYNDEFNNKIESYGLSGKVNVIGEINDAKLAAYYSYSDVFVSCSEHEGFFVPAIEAQYFGLPVVALRSSAVPETLGENQLLFGNDPAEMAAAIRVICTDDEARKLITDQGRKNYESRFTNEVISAVFEKELDRFIKCKYDDTMGEINSGEIIGILKRAAQEERYNIILDEVHAEINGRGIPEFPNVAFEDVAVK